MKKLIIVCFLLCGCANYDSFTDGYAGFNNRGSGSIGARIGSYLKGDHNFDGGLAVDSVGILGDEVHQATVSPLMMLRYKSTQYLEPYVGAGPSFVYSSGDGGVSSDIGATVLSGLSYRIGDLATKPWWVFLEIKGVYAGNVRLGRSSSFTSGSSKDGKSGNSEPPKEPPEPPIVTVQESPNFNVEDWSFSLVFGVSVRW